MFVVGQARWQSAVCQKQASGTGGEQGRSSGHDAEVRICNFHSFPCRMCLLHSRPRCVSAVVNQRGR